MAVATNAALSQLRARSDADKTLRRNHLIDAATRLFAQATYESVTIAQVAQAAGVAKGTAYLYFPNKETLFLELVCDELTQWATGLTQELQRQRDGDPAMVVPELMTGSITRRPVLRRLLVLLHTVIEPNIDASAAREFKTFLRDLLTQVGEAIVIRLPALTVEDALTLVMQAHALSIGATQLADPPPVIAQVLADDPSLKSLQVDFGPFMTQTLTTLVRGMLARS